MKLDFAHYAGTTAVADGAYATALRTRGLAPGACAEEACVRSAGLVRALTREYAQAGAVFLTTNSFAANRLALARHGLAAAAADISRHAAEITAEVAAESECVALGVLGPTGRILAVRETRETELAAVFAEQAKALAAGGVSGLLLETFSEPAELALAVRAVQDATGLPVVACCSFDSGPQRTRTAMHAEASDVAAALAGLGVAALGMNCGGGVAVALPAVVALRAATDLPLWVKPSAGLPDLVDGRAEYHVSPEEFAAHALTLRDAGADVLGGCCGAGPEHIRKLATALAPRPRSGRR